MLLSQNRQKSPTAGRPTAAAHSSRSTHKMQACAPSGQSARGACRQKACITRCVQLTYLRSTCCAGCSDALFSPPAAAAMSASTKVRRTIDHCTTDALAAVEGPLSYTAMLVRCCHRLRPAVSLVRASAGAVRWMQALDLEGEGKWPPAVPVLSPPSRRSCCSHPCSARAVSASTALRSRPALAQPPQPRPTYRNHCAAQRGPR